MKINVEFTYWIIALCIHAGRVEPARNMVKLGVILPFEGDYPWTFSKIHPAIELAVEFINSSPSILPNHDMQIYYGDSKCSDTQTP